MIDPMIEKMLRERFPPKKLKDYLNPEKKKSRPKPTPILYIPEYVYQGEGKASRLTLTDFEAYLEVSQEERK